MPEKKKPQVIAIEEHYFDSEIVTHYDEKLSRPTLRHRLEKLPCDRGVGLDERAELPRGEPVAAQLAVGGDRGAAGAVVDQGDLAEVIPGAELAAFVTPRRHRGLPALDHEEARTGLALPDDGAAGVERALLERARDSLELAAVEVREERDALQQLEGWSGHARILMGRGRTVVFD